jgi:Sulfotransferase family
VTTQPDSLSEAAPPPLLIIGAPRSGTTWIARVLARTEAAAYVGEPDTESKEPYALRSKRGLGRFPILQPHEDAPEYEALWRQALDGRVRSKAPLSTATKLLLRASSGPEVGRAFAYVDPRLSLRLKLVASLARPPAKKQPGHRVIVKSVFAALSLDWILSRFSPRVMIVKRSPYNIVSSWLALGWHPIGIASHPKIAELFLEPLDLPTYPRAASRLACITWEVGFLTAVLDRMSSLHPEWISATHEQLCHRPQDGFQELCRASGLTWSETAERYLRESNEAGSGYETKRIATEEPERWRKRLSPTQVDEVRGVLREFPTPPGAASGQASASASPPSSSL